VREGPKTGPRMGRKLGATPRFGKAAGHLIIVSRRRFCVHLPGLSRTAAKSFVVSKTLKQKPGPIARASLSKH
jgi:hypothetical protein